MLFRPEVRSAPNSDRDARVAQCPRCANSGYQNGTLARLRSCALAFLRSAVRTHGSEAMAALCERSLVVL